MMRKKCVHFNDVFTFLHEKSTEFSYKSCRKILRMHQFPFSYPSSINSEWKCSVYHHFCCLLSPLALLTAPSPTTVAATIFAQPSLSLLVELLVDLDPSARRELTTQTCRANTNSRFLTCTTNLETTLLEAKSLDTNLLQE
jgi:hypothetical protein